MNPHCFLKIIPLLFIIIISKVTLAQTTFSKDVEYSIPKHNSFFNSTKTNILLKFNDFIANDSLAIKSNITILDNNTPVPYSIIFPTDLKTVILNPINPFTNNVKVEVVVDSNLKYSNYTSIIGFSFWFNTISDNNEIKSIKFFNEFPEYINTDNKKSVTSIDTSKNLINVFDKQNAISVLANNGKATGYYFISTIPINPSKQNRLLILDGNGEIVFEKLTNGSVLDFKKLNESTYSYYNTDSKSYVLLDSNFNFIKQIEAGNGYMTDNHDIQYNKYTKNYVVMAYEFASVNMQDSVVGGSLNSNVLGNIIQEIDKDNNVVFEWKTLDYLPITAAKGIDFLASNIDYAHSNAIEIDNDSNFLLSSRHLNEIEKINSTNGNLIWRFGLNSSNNDFLFIGDTIGFTYQHDIRRLPNGNVTLFDNGNLRQGNGQKYSRALEYKLNETKMTAELVWKYRNSPDVYTQFMGNVQRKENGNTVIGWGGSPVRTFTEIDKKDSVIFEAYVPQIYNYRAYNYDKSTFASGNLIDLKNPSELTYCNEDSIAVLNKLVSVLIPSKIKDDVYFTSSMFVNADTAFVFVKSTNNFFAKSKTSINLKYTKLDQNDTLICKGNVMLIRLNEVCSNATYRWSNNDSSKFIKIKPDTTSYYWVDITNGIFKRRDSVLVQVSAIPILNVLGTRTFVQPYAVHTYSLPNNLEYTYKWFVNYGNIIGGQEINNAIQIQMDSTKPTELNITIMNKYGCVSNQFITINYIGAGSSVNQANMQKQVMIYPNPTNGILNITAPADFNYKIVDITGKECSSSSLKANSSIDLSNMAPGLYTFILNINNETLIYKIQKN